MSKGNQYKNCYRDCRNNARWADRQDKADHHRNIYKKFKTKNYDGFDDYSIDEITLVLQLLGKLKSRKQNKLLFTRSLGSKPVSKKLLNEIKYIEYREKVLKQLYKVKMTPRIRQQFLEGNEQTHIMSFKEFKNRVRKGKIVRGSGYGYYASPDTVYAIPIEADDIIDGHYRTDFNYVYWIESGRPWWNY